MCPARDGTRLPERTTTTASGERHLHEGRAQDLAIDTTTLGGQCGGINSYILCLLLFR